MSAFTVNSSPNKLIKILLVTMLQSPLLSQQQSVLEQKWKKKKKKKEKMTKEKTCCMFNAVYFILYLPFIIRFGWALLRPVSINYGINDGDWDVMPCK